MGTNDNGDWRSRLRESPEILRAELHVYPEPEPYGFLTLFIDGEFLLQVEVTPAKARTLIVLQNAFDENRGPGEPFPVRGRINRTKLAARYRKRAGIIHGIKATTMTSYMGAIQHSLRRILDLPSGVYIPDLLFVRENGKGTRNGVRMRPPGIEVHEIEEE